MKSLRHHRRIAGRTFLGVSAQLFSTLVLIVTILVGQVRGQDSENVPRPQGLIVKTTTTITGDVLVVEWQPPYCKEKEIIEIPAHTWPTDSAGLISKYWYDAHRVVYDESPAFDFEVTLTTVNEDDPNNPNEVLVVEASAHCEPRLSDNYPYPTILHVYNWHYKGSKRRSITAKFEGLVPWVEYRVEVKSIVKIQSDFESNPPALGTKSSKSATLDATLARTALGSGETQARVSGITLTHYVADLSSCSDHPLYDCYDVPWDMRYTAEPHTFMAIAGDFLGYGGEDIILLNWEKPNQFLAQINPDAINPNPFTVGNGGWMSAGDLTSSAYAEDHSTNAVALDANMDGKLDLYITNQGSANVLLINQGNDDGSGTNLFVADDTTITSQQTTSDASEAAVTMDCNGDGAPDLFVVNKNFLNKLFINSASNPGSFTWQLSGAPSSDSTRPSSDAVAFDCRNDGRICIYVANDNENVMYGQIHTNELWIQTSSSSCSFTSINGGDATANYAGGVRATSVLAEDIDGDGDLDLYVTYHGKLFSFLSLSLSLSLFLSLFLEEERTLTVCNCSVHRLLLFLWLELDGKNRLLINQLNNPSHEEYNAGNNLYFSEAAVSVGGKINDAVRRDVQSVHAAAYDIDGDGDLDLLVANEAYGPSILMNDGTGNFSLLGDGFMTQFSGSFPNVEHGYTLAVVAFQKGHRDKLPGILFPSWFRNPMLIPQIGSQSYQVGVERISFVSDTGSDASTTSMSSVFTLAFDYDGDGDLDLLVLNDIEKNQVLINDGIGFFTLLREPADGSQTNPFLSDNNPRQAVYFDKDGDGLKDSVFISNHEGPNELIFRSSSDLSLWTTAPDGDFNERSDKSKEIVVFDADGDGDLDIYVANNAPAANELLLNSGSGQFTRASSAQTKDLYEDDENTNYVTAADFDGDGSIEYVFLFSFREGCSCFFLFLSTSY